MQASLRRVYATVLLLLPQAVMAATIHHVVTTGQSLSLGSQGTPALSTTQPYSNVFVTGGGFIPLVETGQESPASPLANQLTYMSVGQTFVSLVTKHGVSGSGIAVIDQTNASCAAQPPWNVTTAASCPFDNMMFYINTGLLQSVISGDTYVLSASSITHGETDEQNNMSAATYKAALIAFQAAIQSSGNTAASQAPGTVVPMFVDQMSTWTYYNHTVPHVALGQWEAARDNPSVIYMVGPKYQYPYADGLHLTNAGYRQLGWMIGKAMKTVLIDGGTWRPLSPRTLTIAGATITARMWVPGGTLTLDTTTVSDKGNGKGFEFADDSGATPAISSVSCGTDTCSITLASVPTGTAGSFRLRYAYTGTSGALGGASGAAHGNVRDNDTAVGQDGTTPLYDWLVTFDEVVIPSRQFPLPSAVH